MRAGVFRKLLGFIGEALVSLGVVSLLYVAHALWFTNASADASSFTEATKFQSQIELKRLEQSKAPVSVDISRDIVELDGTEGIAPKPLETFGLLYIPRLGQDVWAEPIVSGIDYKALSMGVGYYPETELPGEIGNFAIAGHRTANGEPFSKFEVLRPGDKVFVQTLSGWFEYELMQDQIVEKEDVWVLDDRPKGTAFSSGASLITLTTCHPKWTSTERWVWWGELIATYPLSQPPVEVER